jgi:O-antigen/teichoic acid export membrane protein
MLGIFTTAADVGVYHAAALLAAQVRFVLTAILATFTPLISDLYHRGRRHDLHRLYKTTTRWIVTLSLPFALMLMLFPTPILGLYGADFQVGTGILVVLAAATFVNGGVGASGLMLRMSDYEWLAFTNEVGLAILNVVLNIWLIQRYGPIGAAFATGLSIAIANLIKLIEVYYLLGMTPYNAAFVKPVLAGGVAAGAGWGVAALTSGWGLSWLVGLLTVGIVYACTLALLGLTDEDWDVLRPLLRRVGLSSPKS